MLVSKKCFLQIQNIFWPSLNVFCNTIWILLHLFIFTYFCSRMKMFQIWSYMQSKWILVNLHIYKIIWEKNVEHSITYTLPTLLKKATFSGGTRSGTRLSFTCFTLIFHTHHTCLLSHCTLVFHVLHTALTHYSHQTFILVLLILHIFLSCTSHCSYTLMTLVFHILHTSLSHSSYLYTLHSLSH